jgi:hypothetical protein
MCKINCSEGCTECSPEDHLLVIDCKIIMPKGYAPRVFASMEEHLGLPSRTWEHNVKMTFDRYSRELVSIVLI